MSDKASVFNASILIVDDKDANIRLLECLLRDAGYHQLMSTRDPKAVCDLHAAHQFDLILLDVQMPGMSGFEVLEGLRKIEHGGYVPVLAITVEPGHKLQALAAGAKDFIVKPFNVTELITRIHNLLEVRLLYTKRGNTINALESIALHDALTGLPNRRLLMDRLNQARLYSARARHHCALMFMDLDHFKQLNDTLGHNVGDILLQQVSARLRVCLREGDSVARFGGDEFVVLLDVLSTQPAVAATQAAAIAQKIIDTLGQTYNLNGPNYDSTLSIGVVLFQGDDEPVGTLLKRADLAMYRAKFLGGSQFCLFDPGMEAEVLAQETLAADMRRGLKDEEFVLHYQLQVDSGGTPLGVEALLRWNHARLGLMLPHQFLPMAEGTGMMIPLGHWVLQGACQQLLEWARQPLTASWTLAVNVGAFQLAQADFAVDVANVLKATGAPARQLRLELTEGALLGDVENVIAKMSAVHAIGVGFCLDDFGAGFASLAYLKRLPLVQLKIDQVMVHAVLTDDSVAVIARAIVALGLSMGVPVIAEGVETAAQRDFFSALGCHAFQGNYIGVAALPAAILDDYLNNRPQVHV